MAAEEEANIPEKEMKKFKVPLRRSKVQKVQNFCTFQRFCEKRKCFGANNIFRLRKVANKQYYDTMCSFILV